jgi:hypothetical protein
VSLCSNSAACRATLTAACACIRSQAYTHRIHIMLSGGSLCCAGLGCSGWSRVCALALFMGHFCGPLGSVMAAVFALLPAWGVAVLVQLAGGDGGLLLAGCQYAMWGLAAGGCTGLSGLVHLWTMGWQPGEGFTPMWVTWVLAAAAARCFWFYSTAQGVYAIWFWGWAGGGCWPAAASLLRGIYAFHVRLGRGLGHIFFYP